jgi:hypothetical protein
MTDDTIEAYIDARVERMIEHLDRILAQGDISLDDYQKALADLHRWAEAKRAIARAVK